MMPNKTKIEDDGEQVLFKCECHGDHFLEIAQWDNDDRLWFRFIDLPESLFSFFKDILQYKRHCVSDIGLSRKDIKALIKVLIKFIGKNNKLK